jgi:hypothetical protein
MSIKSVLIVTKAIALVYAIAFSGNHGISPLRDMIRFSEAELAFRKISHSLLWERFSRLTLSQALDCVQ